MASVAVSSSTVALGMTIPELLIAYADEALTPSQVVSDVLRAIEERGNDGTWITVGEPEVLLARARELESDPAARRLTLYGIPFGVKDSIDVVGYPTTLACPDYAYLPDVTAPVVQRLLDAGAVMIGKTNLDQFATGLNGHGLRTRSRAASSAEI